MMVAGATLALAFGLKKAPTPHQPHIGPIC